MDKETKLEIVREWAYNLLFFFAYIAPAIVGFIIAYWTFFDKVSLIPIHFLLMIPFIKFIVMNEIIINFLEHPIIKMQRSIFWLDGILNYLTFLGVIVLIESCSFGLMYFLLWLF